jgi:asparagine synthase (glutamine-hydrolysing)
MCGIAGAFAYRTESPVAPEELARIRDAMRARGPDDEGLWMSTDGRAGLAHRRLAIIDLTDAASQPMASSDGRLQITFNGEIYNYRPLRRELEAAGAVFRTESDTEVLLHLYARRGPGMLQALRGMYAFAIWDEERRELFLARDPFGIKPLYYADDGKAIRFASQVKALVAGGAVDTAPEPAGSTGFLVWGHVPEPWTLYRGIRALPAGTWMLVADGKTPFQRAHFDVSDELRRAAGVPLAESTEMLRAALADTVRAHLVANVPVGLFLSAGVDSTTLAAHAMALSPSPLRAVTLGFDEYRGTANDEVPLASRFAGSLGMEHHVDFLTRDDFEAALPALLDAMDQPTIDGVNTYFVSRAAAQAGMKVSLSGIGGDEIFAGYPSYRQVPLAATVLAFARKVPMVGRLFRRTLAPLARAVSSPKYAGLLEYGGNIGGAYLLRRSLYMPWELGDLLDPATVHVGLEKLALVERLQEAAAGIASSHGRVAALELGFYLRNQLLRDADWAGMAHSLEVRVPFIDVEFFRALAPLMLSGQSPGKAQLARSVEAPQLEARVARAKTGFSTPVRQWTVEAGTRERGLRGWARRVLPPQPRMFRALALVTDAFGGNGGIAKFNRDLITAVSRMPRCAQIVVMPRLAPRPAGDVPERVRFVIETAGAKIRYVRRALAEAAAGPADIAIAGHINLAPLAAAIARAKGASSLLMLHGIDAWTPRRDPLVRPSLATFTRIVGVSRLTLERFRAWAHPDVGRLCVLPNCVDLRRYGPGPKPEALAAELGVAGRTVLLTLGRLASEERYKGFDEVIGSLPALAERVPDIAYLVCGDGPDLERLRAKARALGVADRVIFAGFIPEARKADYYRLADAYVMPSKGEGFGIVFLEALACGIPALGSTVDGGREALLEGKLGRLVDPSDSEELVNTIVETLKAPRGVVPAALSHYSWESFEDRTRAIVESVLHAG